MELTLFLLLLFLSQWVIPPTHLPKTKPWEPSLTSASSVHHRDLVTCPANAFTSLSSLPTSPYLQYHCQGSGLCLLSPGPQHLLYCPCPCLQYGSLTPNPCHIMVAFIYGGGKAYLEVNESFCICIYFFLFSPVSPSLLSFLPFSLCYTHIQPSGHYVWCFLTSLPKKERKRR